MNLRDKIGKRGENLFRTLITKWCDDKPWFNEVALGDKHEAMDFVMQLFDAGLGGACFYVQVKATRGGYLGTGSNRRLKVRVSGRDVEKLKAAPGPSFVVGIDIVRERGYIQAVTRASRALTGVSTRRPLNCRTIKGLWREVDDYWKSRPMTPARSNFSP